MDEHSILEVVDKIGNNIEKNQLVQNSLKLLKLNSHVNKKLEKIKVKREEEDFDFLLTLSQNQNFHFQKVQENTRVWHMINGLAMIKKVFSIWQLELGKQLLH